MTMFEDGGPSSRIEFYRASGPYGCFSNLWLAEVIVDHRVFRCSEYAYQFRKPKDPAVAEWLMLAPTPRLCASAAHGLLVYDWADNWTQDKVPHMERVLFAKITQHPSVARALLSTGDAEIVEASRSDPFWGIGARGTGHNMLGVLLMKWRGVLAAALRPEESLEETLLRLVIEAAYGRSPAGVVPTLEVSLVASAAWSDVAPS